MWGGQLGKVDVTPHRIEVIPRARPRRPQPDRTSRASREVIAKEVQRERDLGVIEPSSAEWAFPVVLVPKRDGTMRFYVDYRQLNEETVRDEYPLLRMDDCIDFLWDAKVFSTRDCNSGYWQIPRRTRTTTRRPLFATREPIAMYAFLSVCLTPRRPSNWPSI